MGYEQDTNHGAAAHRGIMLWLVPPLLDLTLIAGQFCIQSWEFTANTKHNFSRSRNFIKMF